MNPPSVASLRPPGAETEQVMGLGLRDDQTNALLRCCLLFLLEPVGGGKLAKMTINLENTWREAPTPLSTGHTGK